MTKEKWVNILKAKSLKVRIVDASALLDYPNVEKYREIYRNIQAKSIFILTAATLGEIDAKFFKWGVPEHERKEEIKSWLRTQSPSRGITGGVELTDGSWLFFYPWSIQISDADLQEISTTSVDVKLIQLAKDLKAAGLKSIEILTSDSLLQVLAREYKIPTVYPRLSVAAIKLADKKIRAQMTGATTNQTAPVYADELKKFAEFRIHIWIEKKWITCIL